MNHPPAYEEYWDKLSTTINYENFGLHDFKRTVNENH
jgi:hypothetical protein